LIKLELILGAGSTKDKRIAFKDLENIIPSSFSGNVLTLDINEDHNPDVVWDLNNLPLPFDDETFDEIHAYEVLEHFGKQGDYVSFFSFFNEAYRIMKPGSFFFASVPLDDCMWTWGDPGHVRVINSGTLVFLSQKEYDKQIGKTSMTDYRFIYKGDFEVVRAANNNNSLYFILRRV
jgi:SAM-dependent methyltransferase